jgi:hypothetical protein
LIEAVCSIAENRFEAGGARPIMLPANALRLHVRKRKRIDEGPQLFAWAGCRREGRNRRAGIVPAN